MNSVTKAAFGFGYTFFGFGYTLPTPCSDFRTALLGATGVNNFRLFRFQNNQSGFLLIISQWVCGWLKRHVKLTGHFFDTNCRMATLITQQQAAKMLGLTVRTIRSLIADGTLKGYRIGPRTIRLRLDEVEAALVPVGGGAEQERLTWRGATPP